MDSSSIWPYIQLEAMPFIALLVVLYISVTRFQMLQNVRRFQILVILVMAILAVDGINWYALKNPLMWSTTAIWFFHILYFLLTEVIAYFWFLYVYYQIHDNVVTKRQTRGIALSWIPLLLVVAMIVCSPWTHSIFYIDEHNQYYRGSMHFVQVGCGFGFMLAASICACLQRRKVKLMEQKKECEFLCVVVLLPLVGGAVQIMNYDCVLLWPFTAGALFLIFMDYQKHRISIDALTGLNNRGTLERYLQYSILNQESGWYVIMMDIDRFKAINDQYGHIEGDCALQVIAQALKNVFGATNAFISRYGGDEFAIIARYHSDAELEELLTQCTADLAKQTKERNLPYQLQISAGYARFEGNEQTPVHEVFHLADQRMYQQKKLHKLQNG